jgi:hypothetical protein
MRRLALAALALAPSCGREPAAVLPTEPGVTSVAISSSTSETSASTSTGGVEDSSAGGESSSGGGNTFDMGLVPDFEPPQPPGCQGKIDFLFVISRLGTMKTEQDKLLPSLPGFIATIGATFPTFDTHIMVANPDGTWPGWACETPEFCGSQHNCGPNALDYPCGPETWDLIEPCDETIGAGIVFNAGPYATNHPCALAEDRRYIVLPGEPDPEAAFDCIARVGTYGPSSPLGEALVAAVSPAINADGCNAGFLRPDALLVVTMITDNQDDSWTKPPDWYEAVVTAKEDPGAAVMLAIQPQVLVGEVKPNCTYDFDNDSDLRQFINMFPFHAEGDVCADSYVPFFETAVAKVADACATFVPG